jgi:hypothetical protein
MKGLVFTELFELVEEKWGFDFLDELIEDSSIENGGVFTQVADYPFSEMQKLVVTLSQKSGVPINDLLEVFGHYLFSKLAKLYPHTLDETNALDFISTVESHVHKDVRKLYPGVDLPSFELKEKGEKYIVIIYHSPKGLEALAKGLMLGCGEFFKQKLKITSQKLQDSPSIVEFRVELDEGE